MKKTFLSAFLPAAMPMQAPLSPSAHGLKKVSLLAAAMLLCVTAHAGKRSDDVLKTAQKVNDYFMATYADPCADTFVKKRRTSNLWTRAVYYEGLMALYDIDHDQRYLDYTDLWGNYHKWDVRNGITTRDADNQCCGQTYLMRYVATGNKAMMEPLKANLDAQMSEKRYDYWTWIDAIQMSMPVYAQMYRITGKDKYIKTAWKMYEWTRNTCGKNSVHKRGGLFNTKTGLWWRDKDFVPPYQEQDGKDCYWSRGNGWVYAALVRTMSQLPAKSKYHKKFLADFLAMSFAIKACQRPDGFWNVSMVSPTTFGGPETSGTALFLYGICWGINNGYLSSDDFLPVAQRAWDALQTVVHDDGFLGYVQGTGKEPKDGQPVTFDSKPDFEDYGTGCFLLGACEYIKLLLK